MAGITLALGALVGGSYLVARGGSDQGVNAADGSATVPSPSAAARQADEFRDHIQPFFKKHCVECHAADEPSSDVALDKIQPGTLTGERSKWETVLSMLEVSAMPPEDRPQPSAQERSQVVAWIESELYHVDCKLPADPGRVTIRRLNRNEYDNTVRDLLGVKFQPADDFPSDDVGYGFDNIGDVLSLPPLLLEKYMDAAEKIADAVIVTDAVGSGKQRKELEELSGSEGTRLDGSGLWSMYSSGEITGRFKFSRAGEYQIRVEAGEDHAGDEFSKMLLRIAGREQHTFTVKARRDSPDVYEFKLKLDKAGTHPVIVEFINDYYNPKAKNRNERDRNLYVRSLEVIGPLDFKSDDLPASHRQIVTVRPGKDKSVAQAAHDVLRPLMTRAFRRPVQDEEVERLTRLVEFVVSEGDSYERGIQVAVSAVLVSPHFLFRVEHDAEPNNPQARHRINQFELATRLSYFLWSSMPDETLFELARQGKLSDPAVVEGQVKRMLKDDRSRALVENFGGQWLTLRNLDEVTPDPKQFPGFDDALRRDMRRETELFFAAVVNEDRSILDFLDGKFTFINERLAKHYGLSDIKGNDFRRIELDGRRRAGILTQASILTLTSNPTRTSPVQRGKWIMENILGTPPPDPPPDVPELEATQKAAPNASLREQLELHRKDPGCASCHRTMDALGFGFENFDAIGRWRDFDGKLAIDSSGQLPDGSEFSRPGELVTILRGRREAFSRLLAKRMMTYALGRGLEYYDRCAVDGIAQSLAQQDYRFSALVTLIATSEPFRMRRGDGGQP